MSAEPVRCGHYFTDPKTGIATWVGSTRAELEYWRARALRAEASAEPLFAAEAARIRARVVG